MMRELVDYAPSPGACGVGACARPMTSKSDPRETSGPRTDRIPPARPAWRARQYRELKKNIFFRPPGSSYRSLWTSNELNDTRTAPWRSSSDPRRSRRLRPDHSTRRASRARQLRRSERRAATASARRLLAAGTPSPRRWYLGIKASTRRGQDGDFLSYVSGQGGRDYYLAGDSSSLFFFTFLW